QREGGLVAICHFVFAQTTDYAVANPPCGTTG
ncbi:MAG: hypothetical protein JWM66_1784, partial [Solirubrobacterales bacterium]|nr:hypothetical protein [Solirubrobacterales bacterium]